MHWIGLALLLAAVIIFSLALRGRVVARGRFCRKCRFDLQGLDRPTCPECGGDLDRPKATRPSIRRASRLGLAASGVLILLAGSLTVLAATSTARLVAALPDTPVVLLARAGVDDAVTELVTRTDRTPPMEPRNWTRAVNAGLAHQARTDQAWDFRWGTVLSQALLSGRMSEEQIASYVANGYEIDAGFRDRVAHGDGRIAMSIRYEAARLSAQTPDHNGIRTPAKLRFRLINAGWTDREGRARPFDDPSGTLWIPPASSQFRGRGMQGLLEMDTPWDRVHPGERLRLFAEFELTVIPEHANEGVPVGVHRFEQEVRVLGPDEPVITVSNDPEISEHIRSNLRAASLKAFLPMLNPDAQPEPHAVHMAYVMFSIEHLPIGLAGTLTVRLGEEEWPLGQINSGSQQIIGGMGALIGVPWRVEPEHIDAAAGVVRRWIDAGEVDLVFRPEPELAIGNLAIDQVQNIELLYERVRVEHAGFPGNTMTYIQGRARFTASPHPPTHPPPDPAATP
ncbi:MAG: hypothetical protein LAT64_01950 [Phycisphaerales bacterium]|nr:hypothetical protein [Phycisphaerales bacterium]